MLDDHSVTGLTTMPLVAYQGVPGAFGEAAILRHWRRAAWPYPTPTFAAALEALRRGVVARAVIPVWNSSTGEVTHARAALDEYDPWIVRECDVDVPVTQCLVARPGTSIEQLRFVGSHPAALAQCAALFAELPHVLPCEAFNTAGAARDIAYYADRSASTAWYSRLPFESPAQLAAIASERAAENYGLVVLRRAVQADPANRTRFAVLRSRAAAVLR